MYKDPLTELLEDPDKRAKLSVIFVGLVILSTVMIVSGMIIFIYLLLKKYGH